MHLSPSQAADLDYLLRLVVAIVLSGVLGWERGSTGKSAGLRTHMTIGMGAALFIILPEVLITHFRAFGDAVKFDPDRVVQGVVAGVSFIGAGTIFVSRGRNHVRGLTTAASVWTTTGIGMCAGMGRFGLATGATALLMVVLGVLRHFEPKEEMDKSGNVAGGEQTLPGQESVGGESAAQSARRKVNPGA